MINVVNIRLSIIILIAMAGLTGCLSKSISSGSAVSGPTIEENLTYQGSKARITIGEIKSKANRCSSRMANAIGEMLSTSLSNVGDLIVLANQNEVAELAGELQLANSGYVEQGSGPETGLMEGADIMVLGSVTAFEPDAGGTSGVLNSLSSGLLSGIGLSKKEAKISMDIKLVDIRTRRVLKAIPIHVSSSSWGVNATASKWGNSVDLGGALATYSNSPMEDAIREAIGSTVVKVSKQIPKSYYRYKGQGEYSQ